jgi:hypothetical protein
MKIFSFNIHGLGMAEKRREIRRLIVEKNPDVFCIQETKLEVVDDVLCRSLWGSDDVAYSFKPSVGASGGILTMWNTRVVDIWMTMTLPNSLFVKGKFLINNVDFCLANVYAPCDNRGRRDLWNAIGGMLQSHNSVAWCVLGDFNAVRSIVERKSRSLNNNNEDFAPFNHFIDGNSLVDLPLCGRNYIWYRGDGLSMSCLDRFFYQKFGFLCSLIVSNRLFKGGCQTIVRSFYQSMIKIGDQNL